MSDGNIIQPDDLQLHQPTEFTDFIQEDLTLEEFNCRIVKSYLVKYNNNVVKVAEKLDMGKSTIYRMIKEGKI